jgi:hypothetical protein
VSGNPLCAAAYASLKLPFLLWLGTPWQEDRTDRVRTFPPALKLLDRRILRAPGGRILCIRHGTARALEAIAGQAMDGVLIRPVDGGPFQPKPERVQPWMIGFSGRYGAPRKHITLLLAAVIQGWDLFVIPSHQGGLCIAALEAPRPWPRRSRRSAAIGNGGSAWARGPVRRSRTIGVSFTLDSPCRTER